MLVLRMQNRLVEFFPLCLLNVPLFWAPRVHLHTVLCLVGASALVNYGLAAKVFPACCVAIISFCLFVCTITELCFKDTSDLWTPCFNRTNRDHVCAFSGAFCCSVLPHGAIYSNTHSFSRTCQNTRLRIFQHHCYACTNVLHMLFLI